MKTSRWTIIGILIVLALVLAACGGSKAPAAQPTTVPTPAKAAPTSAPKVEPTAAPKVEPTEAPKPTETPKPAPTAAPTLAEPTEVPKAEAPTGQAGLDLMLGAMRAQLSQKAFRMNMTTEDGGKTTIMTIEFVAPDSFHSSSSNGSEIIIIKGATYTKGADGKWQKSTVDMSNIIAQVLDPKAVEDLAKNITVDKMKFIGPDVVDGKPMWVYQYDTTMDLGGTKVSSTAKVWLGVLDKLPYKQESESDSVVNKGGKTKTSGTWQYDPSMKIEAPIP